MSTGEELIEVGRVGRPHGIAGEFAIEDASEAAERFELGATLYVESKPAIVLTSKRAGGRFVIRLDRAVERGQTLAVSRSQLPPPPADSFYVFDLVGLAVEEEGGAAIGCVIGVTPGVANDVLDLDSGLRLPLVDSCVREVDLSLRRIVVSPGFADPG